MSDLAITVSVVFVPVLMLLLAGLMLQGIAWWRARTKDENVKRLLDSASGAIVTGVKFAEQTYSASRRGPDGKLAPEDQATAQKIAIDAAKDIAPASIAELEKTRGPAAVERIAEAAVHDLKRDRPLTATLMSEAGSTVTVTSEPAEPVPPASPGVDSAAPGG